MQREAVVEKDADAKFKGKLQADADCQAHPLALQLEDAVLIKAKKVNKLSPTFAPEQFRVVDVKDNEVTIQRGWSTFRRSISDVKICLPTTDLPVMAQPSFAEVAQSSML